MQDVGGDPKGHLALRRMGTNCRGFRTAKLWKSQGVKRLRKLKLQGKSAQ